MKLCVGDFDDWGESILDELPTVRELVLNAKPLNLGRISRSIVKFFVCWNKAMDSGDKHSGWFEVGNTYVPSPPRKTKLTIVEATPKLWKATYPTNATGLRWTLNFVFFILGCMPGAIGGIILAARFPWLPGVPVIVGLSFFLPLILAELVARCFTRRAGGVIQLEPSRLHYERGAIWRTRKELELEPSGRFEVDEVGGEENTLWVLQLVMDQKRTVLATTSDLGRTDLHWLCHRLNEFLGWEFPSHCLLCGHALDVQDVDWPRRSIRCQSCEFEGPSPDPFPPDAVPEMPIASCPSCLDPIWLTNVHRETGGCRCRRCGWASDREPPLSWETPDELPGWIGDLIERTLGRICDRPKSFLKPAELQEAIPSDDDAWSQLQAEQLAVEENLKFDTVTYAFRQMVRFWWVILVLCLLAFLTARQLYFHYQAPMANRHFAYYVDRIAMQFFLLCCLTILGGLIWWSFQTVRLKFTDNALHWIIGRRERLIAWHTLTKVVVPVYPWPPMILFKHGGTGLLLITPTATAARALARICLSRLERPFKCLPDLHTEDDD